MFWKSITLTNYLPFTHIGNKKVHVDFDQPVCAFLGTNGSGKSSLLRALTPYPAVRTDYGQHGCIVKVLEHDGSIYELTSDFANAAAPHSFKKDGVELNLSGTTETQKDLVEENFGITKLIDDLLIGNAKICDMSKSERKALFSSTYPGDLSFVLDYHKHVCSQIRACGSQLKLLKGREATIRSSLIDEAERAKLERFKTGATDLINRIDKCTLLLEEECKRYSSGPKWTDNLTHSYTGWEPLDVRDAIIILGLEIKRSFREFNLRSKLKDNYSHFDLEYLASRHKLSSKNARDRIEIATVRVEEVRDELNKFIACREANQSISEKTTLEERFNKCQIELDEINRQLGLGPKSVVDSEKIDEIEMTGVKAIRNWVEAFHPSSGSVKTRSEIAELGIKLEHARIAINEEIRDGLSSITVELHTVKDKLDKLLSRPYPKTCVEVCPLRTAVADNIEATDKRFKELVEHKSQLVKQSSELQEFINVNQPIYDEQIGLHRSIGELIKILQFYNLETVALNGEDPIVCCNEHCFEITNRVVAACATTRLTIQKQKLMNEMEGIRHTLSTMANTKQLQVSEDIIESTIKDREEKLNIGIQEIEELERYAKKEEFLGEQIERTADKVRELKERVEDARLLLNQQRVEHIIQFDEDLLRDLSVAKQDLSDELYKVNKTLQDQQKYLDILESEIIPTTTKVQHDKEVYEQVADGLSPTSGLPCIYLIRFINRLIARANEIISDVWFYGMEIVYLKEDVDLDFSLQVLIKNATTVKDLSLLSMGQQAIVNLAMTAAICMERGFFDKFSLRLDEIDGALTEDHRTRLVCMLNKWIDSGAVKQMFLVNHFAIQTGMSRCDSVCLSTDGIVTPNEYNTHATIE